MLRLLLLSVTTLVVSDWSSTTVFTVELKCSVGSIKKSITILDFTQFTSLTFVFSQARLSD